MKIKIQTIKLRDALGIYNLGFKVLIPARQFGIIHRSAGPIKKVRLLRERFKRNIAKQCRAMANDIR